jgi:hypothetical protein
MWLNHWTTPPGCTWLLPRLSLTNFMDNQPHFPWVEQATWPNTRQQQLRCNDTILLHCSSMASATKHIGTSRRRSTTMTSKDPTPPLAPRTRSSRLQTSINPPTNSTSLVVWVGLPLCRKARWQWQQQWWQRHYAFFCSRSSFVKKTCMHA